MASNPLKKPTNRPNSNITDRASITQNDPLYYAEKQCPRYRTFRELVESQSVSLRPSLTLTSVVAAAHQQDSIGAVAMDLNISDELARTLIDELDLDAVLDQQSADSDSEVR